MPVISPQPGPQEAFLASPADIAVYGGAAGSGKTWAVLLEPLRHVKNRLFSCTIFRRTAVQIRNPGGLWDESGELYGTAELGGRSLQQPLEWIFPSGMKVKMSGLEHENSVLEWQGAQLPLIIFDELTHFTAKQFWYLMSRNRSMSGVAGYVRATCNPDADSWVSALIEWWIDQETGFPIPSRAGVLRYFVRVSDKLHWAGSRAELVARYPDSQPKSLTFIPAKLSDNRALMDRDPTYLANLMALPKVERARLLDGNWKIRPAAGLYFNRNWVRVVDAVPGLKTTCRGWDLAATPKTEFNDPDFTAGAKIAELQAGGCIVLDHFAFRGGPGDVQMTLANTASRDGRQCFVSIPQDPGAGGKAITETYEKILRGYHLHFSPETRPQPDGGAAPSQAPAKIARFNPFSAACEQGKVQFLRGDWNEALFASLEAFPDARHDDDADAVSRAFNYLTAAPAPARAARINIMGR